MKRKTICSGILVTVSVGFLLAAMLNLISFSLTDNMGDFARYLEDALNQIPGVSNGSINCSGFALIRELLGMEKDSSSEEFNQMLLYFQVTMVLPYVLSVITIVLALFRKRWCYGITLLYSLVSGGLLAVNALVMFPKVLSEMIDSLIGNNLLASFVYDTFTAGDTEALVQQILFSSLGVGFWVSLGLLAAGAVTSVVGLAICGEQKKNRASVTGRKNQNIGNRPIPGPYVTGGGNPGTGDAAAGGNRPGTGGTASDGNLPGSGITQVMKFGGEGAGSRPEAVPGGNGRKFENGNTDGSNRMEMSIPGMGNTDASGEGLLDDDDVTVGRPHGSFGSEEEDTRLEPAISCIAGEQAGGIIRLQPGEWIVVGRDARVSHLVLKGESLSRRHCSICYDPGKQTYLVKDYSLNGTFADGRKLQENRISQLPSGTVLMLGNEQNQLRLM